MMDCIQRRFILLLLGSIVFVAGSFFVSAQAHDPGESFEAATKWHQGYTLILMDNQDIASANQARDYVISQRGRIAILIPPHVMLGWISPDAAENIIGKYGIRQVCYKPIDLDKIEYRDERTRTAVSFFNSISSGSLQREMSRAKESNGEPLINDVFIPPPLDLGNYERNLKRFGIAPSPGNSDAMIGIVAVSLFFVESDDTMGENKYSWTVEDQQYIYEEAMAGLSAWSNVALAYGAGVSFTAYLYSATDPVTQQGYEPILHSSMDDSLWINQIMANLGFASGDKIARVTAFNTWQRNEYGTDRAYSVFIAYNPRPSSSVFTDGRSAYSYMGGPYFQALYRNNGWVEEQFHLIMAHETGHIFWACDEYVGSFCHCGICAPDGPRPTIENGNCETCCTKNCSDCIMRYNGAYVCSFTAHQIGWMPNLTPYRPDGWSDKIVVSKWTGTHADSDLSSIDTLYVDLAVTNESDVKMVYPFRISLYVDETLRGTWDYISLDSHSIQSENDYPIGSLEAGEHTLKIVIDTGGVVTETSKEDNEYAKTITVEPPQESLSIPKTPSGPKNGVTGLFYTYETGGSTSDLGHPIEYRFDWSDGALSSWSPFASSDKSWSSPGTYAIRAQARCATDSSVVSDWSSPLPITIVSSMSGEWSVVTLPLVSSDWYLEGIHFISPGEGWAVGRDNSNNRGIILHYLDGDWMLASLPGEGSNWRLWDVYFVSPAEGWVVGEDISAGNGLLLRYANGTWSTVSLAYESSSWHLYRVCFPSPEEGWTGGWDEDHGRGLLFHYSQGTWAGVYPPYFSSNWGLLSVHLTSPTEGWAVGRDSTNKLGVILHYTSGSWVPSSASAAGQDWRLWDVHFPSSIEGWAVGNFEETGGGILLHYSQGYWAPVFPLVLNPWNNFYFYGTYFSSPAQGWVVGYDPGNGGGLILRFSDGEWSSIVPPAVSSSWWLNRVYFASPAEGWAVGADGVNRKGVLLRYSVAEVVSVPDILRGPIDGAFGAEYSYSFQASVSNLGHELEYLIDWGDGKNSGWSGCVTAPGDVSPSAPVCNALKAWTSPGVYSVRVKARCLSHPIIESDWSEGLQVMISSTESISIPETPAGPANGLSEVSCNYTVHGAISNLDHQVQYQFDWGDGTFSTWSSLTTASKSWVSPGTYSVKAQARCAIDTSIISLWSGILLVTISDFGIDLTGQWISLSQACKTTKKGEKCKITGTLTIQNAGNLNASSSLIRFYLSDDGEFDQGDRLLKQMTTGTIKAGANKVKKFSYNLPLGEIASGKYIIAVIDADNSVTELAEGNNIVVHGPIP